MARQRRSYVGPRSATGERPRLTPRKQAFTPVTPSSTHLKTTPGLDSNPTPTSNDNTDARALVAARLWGRRRYSDSFSRIPSQVLYHETLGKLDLKNGTGNSFHIPNPPRPSEPEREDDDATSDPATPTSPDPIPVVYPPCPTPPPAVEPEKPFLSWAEFQPFPITLRTHTYPTPREEFIDGLENIEAKGFKGVGRLARPLFNTLDSSHRLSDFLARAQRSILRPLPDAAAVSSGNSQPTPRELDRLESKLFDTAKYMGSGANHLTVLTWSADSARGTITLFEVDLDRPGLMPSLSVSGAARSQGLSSLALRRRGTLGAASMALPLAPHRRLGGGAARRGGATALRPVAAMEDVPRQVLVNMRVDHAVRKLVLRHDPADNRFRWAAWYGGRRGDGPTYARLQDGMYDEEEEEEVEGYRPRSAMEPAAGSTGRYLYAPGRGGRAPATATGVRFALEDDEDAVLGRRRSRGRKGSHHARRARERSGTTMRADAWGRRGVDADGVVATIPQFLALLHASRSIVEVAASAPATDHRVETEDGESIRAVVLDDWPEGKRHTGRDVHVVVLVPAQAKWADERIFWTDDTSGLLELRQKKYRDVIDGGRVGRRPGTARAPSGRGWDRRSVSPRSPVNPPGSARSTAW